MAQIKHYATIILIVILLTQSNCYCDAGVPLTFINQKGFQFLFAIEHWHTLLWKQCIHTILHIVQLCYKVIISNTSITTKNYYFDEIHCMFHFCVKVIHFVLALKRFINTSSMYSLRDKEKKDCSIIFNRIKDQVFL